ncbi:hypothetical protein DCAR_0102325 [Daucus carota subsp. sativus]|uniref:Fe2OG dioxygenase domain-containing protein n=1 Tax=Daucus carota subsp. sativus TaxID=79200 RepID=A0A166H0Y8_DAUCS|nr:PREDICTED: DNA oxidative demethylase ALKBH2 [Daucus carota subsp. sativus]WOG83151.1 hypothetical protein DCAR_0102325 [Daucus carota subsp. sativus]
MEAFVSRKKLKTTQQEDDEKEEEAHKRKGEVLVNLGNESQVLYIPKLFSFQDSSRYLKFLNNQIPWTRPTIRVFGRSVLQPRDTCYVGSAGITELVYSGYKPEAHSWDDYPPLQEIREAVHRALPGSYFNTVLLNRYKAGDDYVGWHADDEKLYGPTPEIASVSFGCERDFLLKKKPDKTSKARKTEGEASSMQRKKNACSYQHSFTLKHGSLLVMKGYTQRDWLHSVPKRAKADSVRINLTFRHVL